MQFPEPILEDLKAIPLIDIEKFLQAQHSVAPVSIRSNPLKGNYSPAEALPVPWCSTGYYLAQRPVFTYDPLFHAGAYYVQEASSMFLHQVLIQKAKLNQALKVLDACAAPGGKSTLIASMLNNESLLVCNEIVPLRAAILEQNMIKWGNTNCVVTRNEPAQFKKIPHFFDVIVVDAPCSGSGLFRKDPAALKQWQPTHVEQCHNRQINLLQDLLPCLKPGGLLVYATCSFSTAENEDMVDFLMEYGQLKSEKIELKDEWNITETKSKKYEGFGYRFFPHLVQGEGFFIAAFTKTLLKPDKQHQLTNFKTIATLLPNACLVPFIDNVSQFTYYQKGETIMAMPSIHWNSFCYLFSHLYILRAGFCIGKLINNQLIPHHELALSNAINKQVPKIDVDLQQAISYLKCETPIIETSIQGWALVVYQNLILGWVKIIPGRINNYLPKNWRILK